MRRLRPPRFGLLLVAMVAISVTWHLWIGQRLAEEATGSPLTWLPAYLTWFAVGMALAYAHVRLQEGAGRAPGPSLHPAGLDARRVLGRGRQD